MNAVVSTLPTAGTELTVTVNIPSAMESDAMAVQVRVESAAVKSDADYLTLTDFLGQVALRRTALEADRVKLKKPVLQLGKDIEEMFRTPLLILHVAIDIGKQKLLAYDAAKRAEAEAKTREATTKSEAGEAVAVAPRAAATVSAAAHFTAQRPPRVDRRRPPENHHQLSPLAGRKKCGQVRRHRRLLQIRHNC
jgi:hypothetical protein